MKFFFHATPSHRRSLQSVSLAVSLLLATGITKAACAAEPPVQTAAAVPLLRSTFATGTDGLGGRGQEQQKHPNHEDTKRALRWDYGVQKGDLSALVLPVAPEALAQAKNLRFAVKGSTQTPLAVVLQEKNGGRYLVVFSAPAGAWQTVELAPGDFLLAEGKDDPKDADHKLDMDQVESGPSLI